MGDVSGKGVPAALLMANLQATLRARLPMEQDLARLADALDREIEQTTRPESYLTLFVAIIDPAGRMMRWVNAGHNAQYLCRRDGTLERLEATGRPLGLLAGGGYVERHLELTSGDRLCLFTDGLVEAEGPGGRPFGEASVEGLLRQACHDQSCDLVGAIDDAVRRHRAEADAADDATVLVVRIDGPAAAQSLDTSPTGQATPVPPSPQ
jgi:sigma-B regulation protein RsbU (phosphoserine phosphatase)